MLPSASVTCGFGPLITELPVCEILTSLPGSVATESSEYCSVTVIVAVDVPLLFTLGGASLMLADVAGGVTKNTRRREAGVSVMLSVVSFAVNVACSAFTSVALNTAVPSNLVTTLAGLISTLVPEFGRQGNALAADGVAVAVLNVTSIITCDAPSA